MQSAASRPAGRDPDRPDPWSPARRIGFRFAFLYFFLYGVPGLVSDLPLVSWVGEKYQALWTPFVEWVGGALLRIDMPPRLQNGSGDQLYFYVEVASLILVSALGAIAWSIADRRRADHPDLAELLRIYLRYFLAFTMFVYGMAKILKSQFPEPSPGRLLIPLGQMSPMGVLWTFMGLSTPYTVLAGLVEVAGGALLLFRRTTGLGALLLVGALGNVVALNYCYDVPVKLFSTHLFLIACILLAPDLRRLVDVLVRNRATRPAELGAPPVPLGWRRWLPIAKGLVITAMIAHAGWGALESYREYGDGAEKGPLHGAYRVLAMEEAGRPIAPSDPGAWRTIAIERTLIVVVTADGLATRFAARHDPARRVLEVSYRGDPSRAGQLTASTAEGELRLDGVLAGKAVSIRLERLTERDFLVIGRGFHWVSEAPFNR